jgi:hypothetical protein
MQSVTVPMKQIVVLAAAAVVVSACVSVYSDPVYLPHGGTGYAVHCDGTEHDMDDCRKHAEQICRGPYNTVADAGPWGNGVPGQDQHRVMIVECGSAAPK